MQDDSPVQHSHAKQVQARDADDEDELFAELEKELDDDHEWASLRERRYEQMKQEMERARVAQGSSHGRYEEIFNEKEALHISANENQCVIHFFHRDFTRCKIMDKHLDIIASKHPSTRFIRVLVENAPWLVEKLGVQVLPCVACFVDGKLKHRLIGFEELGNNDEFSTAALEMRLKVLGVIEARQSKRQGQQGSDAESDEED